MRISLILLAGLVLLSGCSQFPKKSANPATESLVNLSGKNNEEATDILVGRLLEADYEAKKVAPGQFIVYFDQHTFIMEPKLVEKGLSRIVVSRVVGIKPVYRQAPELVAVTVALNRHLNFAKFSLLPNNAAGQVQASITFIHNRVDLEEIRQFMLWMDASLNQVRHIVPPEILHMLEQPSTKPTVLP
ncbi:MAG: hypothetical protein R3219_03255 [Hydrogenovibrio sp.]|nr:hypothetical protein [Hydrogenovibrio sp.]